MTDQDQDQGQGQDPTDETEAPVMTQEFPSIDEAPSMDEAKNDVNEGEGEEVIFDGVEASTSNVEQEATTKPSLSKQSVKNAMASVTKAAKSATKIDLKAPVVGIAKGIAKAATQTAKQGQKTLKNIGDSKTKIVQSVSQRVSNTPKKDVASSTMSRNEAPEILDQSQATVRSDFGDDGDNDDNNEDVSNHRRVNERPGTAPQVTFDVSTDEAPMSSSSGEEFVLTDPMIIWIVVLSIALLQTIENWRGINGNSVPLSMVFAWMLVAFVGGLEVDGQVLVHDTKAFVLALEQHQPFSLDPLPKSFPNYMPSGPAPNKKKLTAYFNRIFRRKQRSDNLRAPSMQSLTTLARTKSQRGRQQQQQQQQQDQAQNRSHRWNANLARRLSRFGRKQKKATNKEASSESADVVDSTKVERTESEKQNLLGPFDLNAVSPENLQQQLSIEPLFRLRGMDVFLADCSEQEMATHPFLLKNGLRAVPTLVFNLMTQWGTILTYFEMPEWVQDFSTCLVETESDPEDVKALKRWMNGTDDYRKAHLKIMPELVEAPYPIRLMAPRGNELQLYRPGLCETSYHFHDVAGEHCPIMEVTLDLMGNSTIRGMASLVKRYLKGMSVEFALVISKPDDQTEEEPEACLGFWKMNRLDVSQYPKLPDRFATEGCSDDTINAIRASILVKNASSSNSKRQVAVAS